MAQGSQLPAHTFFLLGKVYRTQYFHEIASVFTFSSYYRSVQFMIKHALLPYTINLNDSTFHISRLNMYMKIVIHLAATSHVISVTDDDVWWLHDNDDDDMEGREILSEMKRNTLFMSNSFWFIISYIFSWPPTYQSTCYAACKLKVHTFLLFSMFFFILNICGPHIITTTTCSILRWVGKEN